MQQTNLCGITLKNPLGITGFDKDGDAIRGLHKLGFGFVEIGNVCPDEQSGNEKPRVFLLEEDEAIINRYGFKSKGEFDSHHIQNLLKTLINCLIGHEYVVPQMRRLRKLDYKEVIGINLGKNSWTDSLHDYTLSVTLGVKVFSPTANYLVVNISSPDSKEMRKSENLKEILKEVIRARLLFDEEKQRPIFIKLSPDLSLDELKDIVDVTRKKECKIDGFIISNTTIGRMEFNLRSKHQAESGDLSGKPLREKSTKMIEDVYKLTNGKTVIIGAGGISSGQDAFEKILAGASVVEIFTSFMYHGPPVVVKIKRELNDVLLLNGYKNVSEAVGKGVQLNKKLKFVFW